jgi:hypothetical protein
MPWVIRNRILYIVNKRKGVDYERKEKRWNNEKKKGQKREIKKENKEG